MHVQKVHLPQTWTVTPLIIVRAFGVFRNNDKVPLAAAYWRCMREARYLTQGEMIMSKTATSGVPLEILAKLAANVSMHGSVFTWSYIS